MSLLLGLLSSLIAYIQLHFTLLNLQAGYVRKIKHNKDAFPVSVENKSCKTIEQKASCATNDSGLFLTLDLLDVSRISTCSKI